MTFYADNAGNVDGSTETAGELIPSVSIANMLAQRAALHVHLEKILVLIGEADDLAKAAHLGSVSELINGRFGKADGCSVGSQSGIAKLTRALDASGWDYLLREAGVRSFMSAEKRKEWSEAICNCKVPELSADSIRGTFAQLYEDRGAMFDEGVLAIFRKLSWNYKTNTPSMFGKKIISSFAITYSSPNHRFADEIDDLLRVFHVLDGKPEPDSRANTYGALYRAVREKVDFENDYVRVRMFGSAGTGHINFKRLDLVERMNGILAKHYPGALPASR